MRHASFTRDRRLPERKEVVNRRLSKRMRRKDESTVEPSNAIAPHCLLLPTAVQLAILSRAIGHFDFARRGAIRFSQGIRQSHAVEDRTMRDSSPLFCRD